MKIQALRSSYGDNGYVRRGQIVDVPDAKAQQLIKRGIFDTPQNIAKVKSAKADAEKAAAEAKAKAEADRQAKEEAEAEADAKAKADAEKAAKS